MIATTIAVFYMLLLLNLNRRLAPRRSLSARWRRV